MKNQLTIALSFIAFATYSQNKFSQPKQHPLISHIYTADPSAHVFNGQIYIYPSHDIDAGVKEDDMGSHFAMNDYHVFSQKDPSSEAKDNGVALALGNIPWASKMLWAPDAAEKAGQYYLYFPAKDKEGIFRIGVAKGNKPEGPFIAEKEAIIGSFSIDPCVFKDKNGEYYLYVGGIWGGQLQRWKSGKYQMDDSQPSDNSPALMPKIAKLKGNMIELAEPLKDVKILDEKGQLLLSSDHDRRFFEAAWVHVYQGKYYLSYSTGDTHHIAYATSDSPYGPFVYQGEVLKPVNGWTNHHSIVEFGGKWYLYYHDVELSGKTHLRNIKMTELKHDAKGKIEVISAYN
ncbi:glycoside hydrolase family 43 protein [Aquirufa sp. ROCK2-A2]